MKIACPTVLPLNVYVINEEGQEVITEKIISPQQTVDEQSLPAGIYLFRLISDHSEAVNIPFIKQ